MKIDLLFNLKSEIDFEKIDLVRKESAVELARPHWNQFLKLMNQLKTKERESAWYLTQHDQNVIDVTSGFEEEDVMPLVEALTPWRKGPYRVFNTLIDSEWQSWMKWNRVKSFLPSLENKKIADVGSGNGYFMFQLAKLNPGLVLAFERSTLAYYQFEFLQHFAQDRRLQMELIDSDALPYFNGFFDLVFCMGVAYHTRNPMLLFENIKLSLKPGGHAFIESQIWPGDGSFCFFNEDRYAKVRNVYFVPTLEALKAWAERSGFKNIEVLSVDKTSLEEQRKTEFAPFESLEDFLDPKNPDLTVEGHPAPIRALIRAEKL